MGDAVTVRLGAAEGHGTIALIDNAVDPGKLTFDQDVGAESDQLTGRLTTNVSGTVFQNLAYNDLVGKVI